MYNKITLVGHLTRDLELKHSNSGYAFGKTGIATNRKWKDQNGQNKEEVMFVDVGFMGKTAETANKYLRKGSKVLIDGRLIFNQWEDKDGGKRSKHEVVVERMVMLDGKPTDSGQ